MSRCGPCLTASLAALALLASCNLAPARNWFARPTSQPAASNRAPASNASPPSQPPSAARGESTIQNPKSKIDPFAVPPAGAKLVPLADFDRATKASFRVDPPAAGSSRVDRSAGRRETGTTGLRVTLTNDAAVIAEPAAGWVADWRGFTLFGAAVHSKTAGVPVTLELRSGPRGERIYRSVPARLRQGWNTLRLDLGDAGPLLDRSRVVQVAFRVSAKAGPVDLVLDDLVLLDNREALFGSPDEADGTLYAQRAGTRMVVGAAGRYELVFDGGRIVRCFDLVADPHRLSSACLNGPLGPMPLALHPALIEAGGSVSLDVDSPPGLPSGDGINRTQRLIERGPLRIVIEGSWRRRSATATQPAATDELRWLYTLDRYGRMYVTVRCPTGGAERPPPEAVLLDAAEDGSWTFDVHNSADGAGRFARAVGRAGAAESPRLVWIIPAFQGHVLLKSIRSAGSSLHAAVFADDTPVRETATFRSMLLLWPAAWSNLRGPEPLWADAVRPAAEWGARTQSFDFDRAAYRLTLSGGTARLTIGQDGIERFHPMIEVVGAGGQKVTASCNGAILNTEQRTADGTALMELPEIHRPAEVEIFLR